MSRLHSLPLLLALAAAAAPAAAQPRLPVAGGPGAPAFDASHLRPFQTRYTVAGVRGEETRPLGTLHDVLSATSPGEWLRVISLEMQGGTLVDSIVFRTPGMEPVRHRSHQPTRTLFFEFSPRRVTGTAAGAAVDLPVEGPLYDSSMADLLLAALPLRGGETVELPVFDYDKGGRVTYRARIRGPETMGGEPCWVAELDTGGTGQTVTYWIGQSSRQVRRIDFAAAPGMVVRMTPMAAPHRAAPRSRRVRRPRRGSGMHGIRGMPPGRHRRGSQR